MGGKRGFTREQYKSVKRMDHRQMESFIINIYNDGYEDGTEAAAGKNVTVQEITAAITGVKGIGKKKAAEIMTVVSELYRV